MGRGMARARFERLITLLVKECARVRVERSGSPSGGVREAPEDRATLFTTRAGSEQRAEHSRTLRMAP